MNVYTVTALVLLAYFALAWFLGTILGLQGRDLWILRGLLALLGILAAAAFLWYYVTRVKRKPKEKGAAQTGDSEIDLVIREAEARLASSLLGRRTKLSNLPVIFLVGGSGSTKTSSMVNSGLEPELLAGQVYQENNVVPTRAANVWFARQAVFVEAGGRLLSQPARWIRLVRRLKPRQLRTLIRRRRQPPRAAVVCVSCEEFTRPGATDALAVLARNLRTRLGEIAQHFGISFPVYVLFTKTDRVPFFTEYVSNLSKEEATQVVGVTLRPAADQGTGVYAERETRRLTQAFDDLFQSLCEKRVDFLAREHDEEKLPGIYEFPRELRKLRNPIVQFLVDLCRPSQLRAVPFLRGYYFSGVRPVYVSEPVAPALRPRTEREAGWRGATGIFSARAEAAPSPPPQQVAGPRKIPQWVFLAHFFNDVLLEDRAALGASAASTKTNMLRRILLASAAALLLILCIGFIVSYSGNRGLEARVLEAARGIGPVEFVGANLPSVEALQRLETLRQSLETLSQYEREGPPWRLRWLLYTGDDLYPHLRQVYFRRFHQLLFASTQSALVASLRSLPATPGPNDEYGPIYDTLKAYLISTSHHEKSTRLFLAPVLLRTWAARRSVDPERMQLADKQFQLYSEELKSGNPFSSEHDTLAVERGRRYLSQFAGIERVYRFMLAEASRKYPSVNFNRQFAGSSEVLVNSHEVSGAFTKDGWTFLQDAFKNADRFFSGEEWVLGEQAAAGIDAAKLEQQLRDRYTADFIAQWRAFLKASSVARYGSLNDAARKLTKLSGNQSPLLALLWLVSQNTAVDSPGIKTAFQPAQFVVPPESKDRYIGPSNTSYMNALVALQASVEQVAASPGGPGDPLVGQALGSASSAKVMTRQVAQSFRIDPEGRVEATVQKLMEDPITHVESLLRSLGPAELNAKGRTFCGEFRRLAAKYPFQPNATQQATLAEINRIFQPGSGLLWTYYEGNLRDFLVKQGAQYVENPAGGISLNPAFVRFFNQAVAFSEAVYPGGSPQPGLRYSLKPYPAEGITALNLFIDGQTLAATKRNLNPVQFVWPGTFTQGVRLTGKFGSGPELAFASYDGLWAVFQFFADADRWQSAGAVHRLEWILRQGRAGRPLTLPSGAPLTVRFDLDLGGAAPVFQKNYLAGLNCVSRVAR